VQDPDVDKTAMSGPSEYDTFLFGRRTYELFERFWPHALEAPPSASGPHGGELSDEHRAMATSLNETSKLVFSRTLKAASWQNSRIISELDPREIAAMKQQPGKNMLVLGSGSIASQLSEHDLIDDYVIVVSPLFLGTGQPLLKGLTHSQRLDLVSAKSFPSGNVMLTYTRSASGTQVRSRGPA
jgi:dihydrofolate reductase